MGLTLMEPSSADNRIKVWIHNSRKRLYDIIEADYDRLVKAELPPVEYEAIDKTDVNCHVTICNNMVYLETYYDLKKSDIYSMLSERGQYAADLLIELEGFSNRFTRSDYNNKKRIFNAVFSSVKTGSTELQDFFEDLI